MTATKDFISRMNRICDTALFSLHFEQRKTIRIWSHFGHHFSSYSHFLTEQEKIFFCFTKNLFKTLLCIQCECKVWNKFDKIEIMYPIKKKNFLDLCNFPNVFCFHATTSSTVIFSVPFRWRIEIFNAAIYRTCFRQFSRKQSLK